MFLLLLRRQTQPVRRKLSIGSPSIPNMLSICKGIWPMVVKKKVTEIGTGMKILLESEHRSCYEHDVDIIVIEC